MKKTTATLAVFSVFLTASGVYAQVGGAPAPGAPSQPPTLGSPQPTTPSPPPTTTTPPPITATPPPTTTIPPPTTTAPPPTTELPQTTTPLPPATTELPQTTTPLPPPTTQLPQTTTPLPPATTGPQATAPPQPPAAGSISPLTTPTQPSLGPPRALRETPPVLPDVPSPAVDVPPETALLFPPFPSPGELEPGIVVSQPPPSTEMLPGIAEEPGTLFPGNESLDSTEGRVLRDFESETPVTILGEEGPRP